MSHTNEDGSAPRPFRDKRGLVNRVRRLRGQVDAIERALTGEASCSDVLQRIAAARGAINGLMAEVLGNTCASFYRRPTAIPIRSKPMPPRS